MQLLGHKNVKLTWRLPNYSNVSPERNDLIKLIHFDETKNGLATHRKSELKKLKLSHGGTSYRQVSDTNPPIQSLFIVMEPTKHIRSKLCHFHVFLYTKAN